MIIYKQKKITTISIYKLNHTYFKRELIARKIHIMVSPLITIDFLNYASFLMYVSHVDAGNMYWRRRPSTIWWGKCKRRGWRKRSKSITLQREEADKIVFQENTVRSKETKCRKKASSQRTIR